MQLDVQVIPKATLAIKAALRIFGIVKKKNRMLLLPFWIIVNFKNW